MEKELAIMKNYGMVNFIPIARKNKYLIPRQSTYNLPKCSNNLKFKYLHLVKFSLFKAHQSDVKNV